MPAEQYDILENGHWEAVAIRPAAKPSASARAAEWCFNLLRPAFLTKPNGPRKQLGRSGYLDGLRGFAAFLVYWHHHIGWANDGSQLFESAFAYKNQYSFVCLPGIRIFFSGGHFAVSVFFVMSGYVLSVKPLTLIHAGQYIKLGDNIASALFRRWLRLYIPIISTTLLYLTFWHVFGVWTPTARQPTWRDEVWNWYVEFKNFSFVFRVGGEPVFFYNFHLWSIPFEFKGSIVIYTTLLAFSRCSRNARLRCEVGLILYFMYIVDGSLCSMFVAGMLLCDLDLLATNNELPRFFSRLEPYKEFIFYNLFIISIYLGGVPSHSLDVGVLRESRGWYYLSFLKPQAVFDFKFFYLFWAATFLVASIPRIWWLKGFFEMRINQYLGRISYALYLVHGPVLSVLGDRIYAAAGWQRQSNPDGIPNWINVFPIPRVGPRGLELSFLLPHLILLPVTLWLAELVTKLIDEPSVKFAQWLYGKTLAGPTNHEATVHLHPYP